MEPNLTELCRLCCSLTHPDSRKHILETNVTDLLSLLRVELTPGDPLPKVMCTDCSCTLDALGVFVAKIRTSEARFKEMLSHAECEMETEAPQACDPAEAQFLETLQLCPQVKVSPPKVLRPVPKLVAISKAQELQDAKPPTVLVTFSKEAEASPISHCFCVVPPIPADPSESLMVGESISPVPAPQSVEENKSPVQSPSVDTSKPPVPDSLDAETRKSLSTPQSADADKSPGPASCSVEASKFRVPSPNVETGKLLAALNTLCEEAKHVSGLLSGDGNKLPLRGEAGGSPLSTSTMAEGACASTSQNAEAARSPGSSTALGAETALPGSVAVEKPVVQPEDEEAEEPAIKVHCPHCKTTFHSITDLNSHVVEKHRNNNPKPAVPQPPEVLRKILKVKKSNKSATKKTMKKKTSGKSSFHACYFCYVVFPTEQLLQEHAQNHVPVFQCKMCGMRFQSDTQLESHTRRGVHSSYATINQGPWACSECGVTVRQKPRMMRHVKIHIQARPFQCNVCSKWFKTEAYLQMHHRIHAEQWLYVCNFCGKGYVLKTSFDNHVACQHSNSRPFKCDTCDKCFATKYALRNHVLRQHLMTNPKPCIVCNICGKTCRQCNFMAHMETHTKTKEERKKFLCFVCGDKFIVRKSLEVHMEMHNASSNRKLYQCHMCEKKLSSRTSLRNHLIVHSGLRSCVCEVCGKAFAAANTLKVHQRTHSNERPYECCVCNSKFTQRSTLICHMDRQHGMDVRLRKRSNK